jgi:hypothetical protein
MIARHRVAALFYLALVVLVAAMTLVAVVSPAGASPLPGGTIWSRPFSTSSLGDAFLDVARGPGDVYYCVGITRATEENSTLLLVKYKANGTTAWTRTYKWPGRPGSAGSEVEVDRWGRVLVAGSIGLAPTSSAKGRDFVVLRYSPAGKRLWVRKYDGPAHKDDYPTDMAVDSEGTAYVVGTSRGVGTGQDYALIAVRGDGKLKWTYRYAGPAGFDYPNAIAVDGHGSSYVTGSSAGASSSIVAATVKVSHSGSQKWLKRLQYGNGITHGNDIVYKNVGGDKRVYLTGGAMGLMSTKMNLLVARLAAATGAKVKDAEVDRSGDDDLGEALVVDNAGDAYAVGETVTPPYTVTHALVARVNADASVAWSRELDLVSPENEAAFQCVALSGGNLFCGGYAVVAGSGPEFLVKSVTTDNDDRWLNTSSGTAFADDICRAIVARPGGVYAAGQITRTGSGIDGLLKKIAP